MQTDVSNSETSKRPSNPKSAQPWPMYAKQTATSAIATLKSIAKSAGGIDKHAQMLNGIAESALADLAAGNYENVVSALESIRNETATQRHTALNMYRDSHMVVGQIERALVGKYNGD